MRPFNQLQRAIRAEMEAQLGGMRRAQCDGYPFAQMKFARTPVIVKPISDVAVLLDLDQADPGPDRMNGVRRDIEEVGSGSV